MLASGQVKVCALKAMPYNTPAAITEAHRELVTLKADLGKANLSNV